LRESFATHCGPTQVEGLAFAVACRDTRFIKKSLCIEFQLKNNSKYNTQGTTAIYVLHWIELFNLCLIMKLTNYNVFLTWKQHEISQKREANVVQSNAEEAI
jgi:hypothetical protein